MAISVENNNGFLRLRSELARKLISGRAKTADARSQLRTLGYQILNFRYLSVYITSLLIYSQYSLINCNYLFRVSKAHPNFILHLKLFGNSLHRFFHIFPTIKCRNSEITFTCCAETRTGSSYYIASVQQFIKEIPTR